MTTVSRHTYTAQTDHGIPLSITAGDIALDSDAIPHVEAGLTLAVEDAALLDELDPRESRRVRIGATRGGAVVAGVWVPSGFRYFDLGVREASPDRAAGTVTLRLASDEAILMDYAQLVDGVGAWDVQSSLRAVCNYVLDKIGASLQPGTVDADVTAFWEVTNLHPNPLPASALGYAGGAGAGVPSYNAGQQRIDWTSTASDSNLIAASSLTSYRVTPGKSYVFAIEWATGSSGRTARPAIQWRNNGSASTLETIRGPVFSYSTLFQRMHVIATAPEGAEFAYPLVLTSGNTAATLHVVKRALFYEGDKLIPFFTGASVADANYTYKWADTTTPHATSSIRTPLVERRPESLFWPAGVSGMSFLEPLLKVTGKRLVCDEQRRWWLRDAAYRADGSQNYRHAVNIEQATESLSRDDESWFDAAVYTYVWRDDAGIEYRRVDSFALVNPPTKVLRVELRDTPYPGLGRAEAIVRRAQGRGRTITVTAIPTWGEHTDQPLAVLLEGTPIQTGIAGKITFDLGADTVTATSRTTDTPAGAWILIPTGHRWIDRPVGRKWKDI